MPARSIETALAESIYHRSREIAEVGALEARVQVRVYLADFSSRFHDVRGLDPGAALYDPSDYTASQRFARQLLIAGSHGIVFRSVRDAAGQCIACFRPPLVKNVRDWRPLRVPLGGQSPAVGAQTLTGVTRAGRPARATLRDASLA